MDDSGKADKGGKSVKRVMHHQNQAAAHPTERSRAPQGRMTR